MVTARGRSELEKSASWPAVASGLRWLATSWVIFTLLSLGLQLSAMQLGTQAKAGDASALGAYAFTSFASQLAYSLFAALLVVACAKLTRVPPSAGAMTPALVAGIGFLLAALVNVVLLVAERISPESRSMGDALLHQLWILLASARLLALSSLIFAVLRIARATEASVHAALPGAAFALALVDTGYPLWRVVAGTQTVAQSSTSRGGLLLIQLGLAILLVDLARRARRGAVAQGAAPLPAAPHEESEGAKDDERQAEPASAAPEPVPPLSDAARWLAGLCVAVAVGLLPLWDAVLATSSLSAFTSAVGGAPGTEFPSTALEFAAGGVVLGLLVARLLPVAPFAARGAFAIAVLLAIGYAGVTAHEVALQRSQLIDAWPVCETNLDIRGDLLKPDSVFRGRYDGPRLESGEPCTRASERRDLHQEQEPQGGFTDGVIQIGSRFPEDRARVLYGSLAVLLALVFAGRLVLRAADAEPAIVEDKPVSSDGADED